MAKKSQYALLSIALASCLATGCTSGTSKPSIWPFAAKTPTPESQLAALERQNTGKTGVVGAIAGTASGVKGQFSSMGTAVGSAYGKAKNAVSAAFTGTLGSEDPTSLKSSHGSLTPELFVAAGQFAETTNKYEEALNNYSKALEIEPTNSAALLSTARLYDRMNQPDKASDFFQKAIKAKPNDASLYADLGNVLAKQGQLAAARDQVQKAIAIEPTNQKYHTALAGMMLENGQANEAVQQLEKVMSPALANYNVAFLHVQKQNIPAAQQHLAVALQQDPNLQPARDLMNRINASQPLTQAYGAYQTAGNVMNSFSGLMTTAPPQGVTPVGTQTPVANASSPYATPSIR